jgi:putative membrane protein
MKLYLEMVGGAIIWVGSFFFLAFAKADDNFINKASQANIAEVQAGKLAEAKGNEKVKSFGKQMFADHSNAENELKALAKKENIALPMDQDAEHQQALADMGKLSGKTFDSAYLANQLADHKIAVALFSNEAINGMDPAAKAYAAKYLPNLKMHLKMFEEVSIK